MIKRNSNHCVFCLGLIMAVFFTVLPLEQSVICWTPYWLLLFVITDVLYSKNEVSLYTIFLLGLLADILLGSLWGLQAFSFTIVAFIAFRYKTRFRLYHVWQQTALVSILAMIHALIWYLGYGFVNELNFVEFDWRRVLLTSLCWPLIKHIRFLLRRRSQLKLNEQHL